MPACPVCSTPLGRRCLQGRDRMFGLPGEFWVTTCDGCGLAVTDPALEGQDLEPHYPDQYGAFQPRGHRRGLGLLRRLRQRQHDLQLSLPPLRGHVARSGGRVLDVGCGRGDLLAAFIRRGWQAFGVDPSPLAARAAAAVGATVHEGTLDTASWPDESFDLLLFHHSLEHVHDPLAAMKKARALLRPGGSVFVAVPNWGSWQRRTFRSRWFHLDLPRHLQHFDARALAELAARARLQPTALRSTTTAVGLPGSLQLMAFGRCVLGGRRLRAALLAAHALYPLTLLVGRASGGDCLALLARRP